MEHFLQGVANYIYEKYSNQTASIAVVFPGRRSRLFLNRYLSGISEKPIWAPAYYTITELMEEISGLQVTEKLTLVFELFEVYKKITNTDEKIDDFYFYCEMILSDFDDTDKYLVNADDLFRNLADLKNINSFADYLSPGQVEIIRRFWNTFQSTVYSDEKNSFISLWDAISSVYHDFRNSLSEKKIAYEGMVYRQTAEKILGDENVLTKYDKYLFVGFNALNKAEDIVFSYFKRKGKGEFFWDYDEYYVNNKIHEAGFLLRENLIRFPSPETAINFKNLTQKDKSITFVNISSNSGQTLAVTNYLKQFKTVEDYKEDNTAIVLGDETLLPATLSAIPEIVDNINVSMGYPFKNSSVYDLVYCLSKLSKNSRNHKEIGITFYYKDVLVLLNHPLLNSSGTDKINELKNTIISSNTIYLPASRIGINDILECISVIPSETRSIPDYLLKILIKINTEKNPGKGSIKTDYELEFIYHAVLVLKRLGELIRETQIIFSAQTVFQLALKSLESISVPFSGEPLKGVQVMGILETRCLDFENIIMLSMNEGIFPKSGHIPTLIPLSLRHGFGLPVPEHRDSLYAYYFYRLIQRAKNIVLVYNSQQDGLFSGERSRFLHQLFYEPVFDITEVNFITNVSARVPKKIIVKKNSRIINILSSYLGKNANKYLTPSAINSYLTCSLSFYFKYIEKLTETVEVIEELDPAAFGNVLHKAVELIYRPFLGQVLNASAIEEITKNKDKIHKALDEAFFSEYFDNQKNEDLKGRNIIIKEIILRYLEKILEVDKVYTPFKIVKLEERLKVLYNINGKLDVWLGGVIDRIDEKEGRIRIIDYKTGQKKDTFFNIDDLFDKKGPDRNIAVFQIILYSLLYELNLGKQPIVPGIYFIKNIFSGQFDYHIQEKENCKIVEDASAYFEDFEKRLKETLEELFNPDIPFKQTEDYKSCEFCIYKRICNRG